MIHVTIHTRYPPELGEPPAVIELELSPAYGCRTPAEAHQLVLELLEHSDPAVIVDAEGERWPFYRGTVAEVVTR